MSAPLALPTMSAPIPAPSRARQRAWGFVQRALRNAPGTLGMRARELAYRPFFAHLGPGVRIAEGVVITAPWGIRLEPMTAISFYASLDGHGGIACGERVLIGPYSVLHSVEHVPPTDAANWHYRYAPIAIGRHSIVTSHCVVTSGITIGAAALIGAGAVVTSDVAPGTVVAGVPARPIQVAATRS
jgi:maltose O-acetyltransferase